LSLIGVAFQGFDPDTDSDPDGFWFTQFSEHMLNIDSGFHGFGHWKELAFLLKEAGFDGR
jgi:hypothetical protein